MKQSTNQIQLTKAIVSIYIDYLIFKVFKPQGTLKQGDTYKTKIELASEIIKELIDFGFKIELVLADSAECTAACDSDLKSESVGSLYGEASSFIRTLERYKLSWVLAIRSNHGVLMPSSQRVRANKWCNMKRIFSNQTSETRYIRASYFWQKKKQNILGNHYRP